MPKVSIVVPVYNVSLYIESCVRSLFGQTFADLEFVFVDDCTPDDSMAIIMRVLEDYPHRKSQVKVVRHDVNKGIAITRKDGFDAVEGDYFMYVDGDDYVELTMVELLYEKAMQTNADQVVCDFYRDSKSRNVVDTLVPEGIIGEGDNIRECFINRRVPGFSVCKLYKRNLFEGDFVWPRGDYAEDTVITVQSSYRTKRFAYVNVPLYHYVFNPNSLSKTKSEEKYVKNLEATKVNMNDVFRFLEKNDVADKYGYGIVTNKIRTKNRILRLVGDKKYRRMWMNTYPEVNWVMLFGNRYVTPSYKERIWTLSVMLGIYSKYKKQINKRFKPRKEWF